MRATTTGASPLAQIESLSSDDYERALLALDGMVTDSQLAMLIGHVADRKSVV